MTSLSNGVHMVGANEHSTSYVGPQTWTKPRYGNSHLSRDNEGLNHQIWLCNFEQTYYSDRGCVTYLGDGSYITPGCTFSQVCLWSHPMTQ